MLTEPHCPGRHQSIEPLGADEWLCWTLFAEAQSLSNNVKRALVGLISLVLSLCVPFHGDPAWITFPLWSLVFCLTNEEVGFWDAASSHLQCPNSAADARCMWSHPRPDLSISKTKVLRDLLSHYCIWLRGKELGFAQSAKEINRRKTSMKATMLAFDGWHPSSSIYPWVQWNQMHLVMLRYSPSQMPSLQHP